jgi:hypothetical protein
MHSSAVVGVAAGTGAVLCGLGGNELRERDARFGRAAAGDVRAAVGRFGVGRGAVQSSVVVGVAGHVLVEHMRRKKSGVEFVEKRGSVLQSERVWRVIVGVWLLPESGGWGSQLDDDWFDEFDDKYHD